MRRIVLTWMTLSLAVFLGHQAASQILTTGAGAQKIAATGSFSGPGDVVSGWKAWWGARAYSQAYANSNGKIFNITRASDSQTCDILAATSGGLGNTANCSGAGSGTLASTFCNATTCTIGTAYDMSGALNCSGAACNIVQATVASQPTLNFSCNGGKPCIDGSAGSVCLATTSWANIAQPLTVSVVAKRTGNFTSQQNILNGPDGPVLGPSANIWSQFYGSFPSATASDSAWHVGQFVADDSGTGSGINIDNTLTTGTAGTGGYTSNTALGMFSQNSSCSSTATAQLAEGGVIASHLSSTQQTNMCHNQFTYWGTSTSC